MGRAPTRGGLEERMPVLEVGTGVGYLRKAFEVACRFVGRGKPGDEESGSNAGRSEGAGRFTPAVIGSEGSNALLVPGEESIPIEALLLPIVSILAPKSGRRSAGEWWWPKASRTRRGRVRRGG
jgi:hypothetical protein